MQSSGNLNSSSSNVSRKVYFDIYSRVTLFQIILFIIGFNLMGYFSHIMVMLGTLGFIFGVQIFFFVLRAWIFSNIWSALLRSANKEGQSIISIINPT